ncbi:TatD family hydrolase [Anoxynatronum sibiricum]|uniref:TatD family hydrolase n=1 Tax=Anoxynatronum sibiricum TaxID=210623 RepID=A0ABU9VSM1_9CLOT
MYFDSHAHLDDQKFSEDLIAVLQRAKEAGVTHMLNPGANMASSQKAVALAASHEGLYAAVGIHPHDVKDMLPQHLDQLEVLTREPKVVAIGEIGLDYHYNFSPQEDQQRWFKEQLQLARRLHLPVIIHDREAHGDVFDLIEATGVAETGCVLHCFSGSVEMAREYVKRGIYISLAGPITFHNARKTREVAAEIPLEWLLIETDCPYLAPVPHRGRRNEPGYVPRVADAIAAAKDIPVEEVAAHTMANTKKLFRITE